MDMNAPILNPEQIEDLNLTIQKIVQENSRTIDQVLSEMVDAQNCSIMTLYNLVVQQVGKKRKIIDNLCHFSLTMMSTVQFLWGQKNDYEEKLSSVEIVIGSLNRNIQELRQQNELIKYKIIEAETHIESISGQKQKIQELYRSQSCCNFVGNDYFSDIHVSTQKSVANQKFANQQKVDVLEEYSRELQEKENYISLLRDQNKELQQKMLQLMEEHQLVKMEVQLAEIAVKDALSYRESSMLNSSKSDLNNSYRDEIYTTKSHARFLNGDLSCFSNLEQSFFSDRKHIDINQIVATDHFKDQSQFENQSFSGNSYSDKMQKTDKKNGESPFKRKNSKIEQKCVTEYHQPQYQVSQKKKSKLQTLLINNTKTVSLQCNLLKNTPKIEFLQKLITKKREKKAKNVQMIKQKQQKKDNKEKKMMNIPNKQKTKKSDLSQSEMVRRPTYPNDTTNSIQNSEQKKPKQDYSLSKLLNFFKTKIVSHRIKVK